LNVSRRIDRRDTDACIPSLDTLAMLADPQRDYPTVHITGTNGKGTTTTLTSALLSATGLRVGTFTSPDLHAINERIAVNAEPIDDEEFITLLQRLADVESVSGIALTRFELLTAAAFLHFLRRGRRRRRHRSGHGRHVGLHERH
jgi:dihydrofolate synthase/folylpolyglutamate synthase